MALPIESIIVMIIIKWQAKTSFNKSLNDLKEFFSQGSLIHISELQQEIYSLKQDNRLVTDFFYELKILWKKLRDLFACSCLFLSCQMLSSSVSNSTPCHLPPFQ